MIKVHSDLDGAPVIINCKYIEAVIRNHDGRAAIRFPAQDGAFSFKESFEEVIEMIEVNDWRKYDKIKEGRKKPSDVTSFNKFLQPNTGVGVSKSL
ncbi:MAG: hypothetical protein AAGG69_11655 [Pseudomonadota bacterium]